MRAVYIILILLFVACDKNETIDPVINTLSVSFSNSSICLVAGEIKEFGTRSVSDHGFICGENEWDVINGSSYATKIALGIPSKTGRIEANIPVVRGYYDKTYYARMFIVTDKGIMYGNTLSCTIPKKDTY